MVKTAKTPPNNLYVHNYIILYYIMFVFSFKTIKINKALSNIRQYQAILNIGHYESI